MELREPTYEEQLLHNRIVRLEGEYNQERDRADALSVTNAELLSTLAACQKALHECSLMLRHLNCPGHAAVADIHSEAAREAIAKAKGE